MYYVHTHTDSCNTKCSQSDVGKTVGLSQQSLPSYPAYYMYLWTTSL